MCTMWGGDNIDQRAAIAPSALLAAAICVFTLGFKSVAVLALPVTVHELGHISAILLCGGRIGSVSLKRNGLAMSYGSLTEESAELISALCGPAAGILFYAVCIGRGEFLTASARTSLILSAFNLLPVRPLDGGTVYMCLLRRYFTRQRCVIIERATYTVLMICLFIISCILFFTKRDLTFACAFICIASERRICSCKNERSIVK